jgi:hypothetical protein
VDQFVNIGRQGGHPSSPVQLESMPRGLVSSASQAEATAEGPQHCWQSLPTGSTQQGRLTVPPAFSERKPAWFPRGRTLSDRTNALGLAPAITLMQVCTGGVKET